MADQFEFHFRQIRQISHPYAVGISIAVLLIKVILGDYDFFIQHLLAEPFCSITAAVMLSASA